MNVLSLYIDHRQADFEPDFFNGFALTFSNNDILDPSSRQGAGSGEFTLPASAANNAIFRYAYAGRIQVEEYHPKWKHDVRALVNGTVVFEGKLVLSSIVYNGDNPDHYKISVTGDLITWYEALQNTYLSSLFTGLEVDYDTAAIQSTWNYTADDSEVAWPYVAYGRLKWGERVVAEDMRPAIFWKTILQRALGDSLGYAIESNFLDSDLGKRLIMPYTGTWQHPESYTQQREVRASNTLNITLGGGGLRLFEFNNEVSDPSNAWDTTNWVFTAPEGGEYKFRIYGDVKGDSAANNYFEIELWINGVERGVIFHLDDLNNSYVTIDTNSQPERSDRWWRLQAGDTLQFVGERLGGTATKAGIALEIYFNPTPKEGATLDMGALMDSTIPVNELILDFFRLFNLYCLTDYKRRKIYIEPRDEFYFSDHEDIVDWTYKLDRETIERDSLVSTFNQKMVFRYAQDSNDGGVKNWEERNGKRFQAGERTLPDGFSKGETVIETKHIAPTFMLYDTYVCDQPCHTPALWQTMTLGGERPEPSCDFAPRILIYAGLDTSKTFRWNGGTYTGFPQAYVYDPAFTGPYDSLAFESYWTDEGHTEGLLHMYYGNYIRAIHDGWLLKAKAYLTATDIASLVHDGMDKPLWRRIIQVDNLLYTLNAIRNYHPDQDGLTEVELMKWIPLETTPASISVRPPVLKDPGRYSGMGDRDQGRIRLGLGQEGIDGHPVPETRDIRRNTTILLNGTMNQGLSGLGQVVLGNGLISIAENQTVLGNYNEPNNAVFIIGNGTDDTNRTNLLEYDGDAGTFNVNAIIQQNGTGVAFDPGGTADQYVKGDKTLGDFNGSVVGATVPTVAPTNTSAANGDSLQVLVNKFQGQINNKLAIPSGTAGRIPYFDTANTIANSGIRWDAATAGQNFMSINNVASGAAVTRFYETGRLEGGVVADSGWPTPALKWKTMVSVPFTKVGMRLWGNGPYLDLGNVDDNPASQNSYARLSSNALELLGGSASLTFSQWTAFNSKGWGANSTWDFKLTDATYTASYMNGFSGRNIMRILSADAVPIFAVTVDGDVVLRDLIGSKYPTLRTVTSGGGFKVGDSASKLAFYGAAPVVKPALATYSPIVQPAYTGIDNTQPGTVYASVETLNTLRDEHEKLRTAFEDLKTKMMSLGIVG